MNETCDRCGPAVRAAYRVARTGKLYLCGHCAAQLRPVPSPRGGPEPTMLLSALAALRRSQRREPHCPRHRLLS